MKNHAAKKLFFTAFLLLAVTNLIVLWGVYTNRNGEQEAKLLLTERELQPPYRISDENSGLSLTIIWRSIGKKDDIYRSINQHAPVWLDAEKLKSLGFDIDTYREKTDEKRYGYTTTKECFIVLEFNGERYNRDLEEALEELTAQETVLRSDPDNASAQRIYKRAQERAEAIEKYETRLYAVDAGIDPETLKEKYSDSSTYIITKAGIRLSNDFKSKEIYGVISGLSIPRVHVPTRFRPVFDSIIPYTHQTGRNYKRHKTTSPHPPRYQVTIAYGKRHEPWISSIEPYKETPK
ncbi:MAG: DUF4824 family protein [Campylobacterales bacterium]|nr:DUF4824 family protein [Campylobacterales bacterium]